MLEEEQVKELAAPLSRDAISQRTQSGVKLDYLEGWFVIQTANDIFGFGGWEQEIVALTLAWSGKQTISSGERDAAHYVARVRITAGGVSREDVGYGNGLGKNPGEAHELAAKEAITDAMKRCFRTFGNRFGNCLYDKAKEGVEAAPTPKPKGKSREDYTRLETELRKTRNADALGKWFQDNRRDVESLPTDWQANLRAAYVAHLESFKPMENVQ
jgi:DNA recombination protein Rad52